MRIDLFFTFSVISATIDTQSCSILQIGCGCLEDQLLFVGHQKDLIWLYDIWRSIENFGLEIRPKNRRLSFHDSKNTAAELSLLLRNNTSHLCEKNYKKQ